MAKAVMGILMPLDGSIAGGTMIPSIPRQAWREHVLGLGTSAATRCMRGHVSNRGVADRQIVARMFQEAAVMLRSRRTYETGERMGWQSSRRVLACGCLDSQPAVNTPKASRSSFSEPMALSRRLPKRKHWRETIHRDRPVEYPASLEGRSRRGIVSAH
jgi:hypothetical protein